MPCSPRPAGWARTEFHHWGGAPPPKTDGGLGALSKHSRGFGQRRMWREGPQSYPARTTWPGQSCPVTVLLELPPQATALIGVAHAAPRACCLHAGFGAGAQESVGDRVLHDDVLHPGDVQECQQHPQELRRKGRAGESPLAIWVALSGSP